MKIIFFTYFHVMNVMDIFAGNIFVDILKYERYRGLIQDIIYKK